MKLTLAEAKKMMEENGGSLYLSGTGITSYERKKVKTLHDGDYVPGRYLYDQRSLWRGEIQSVL